MAFCPYVGLQPFSEEHRDYFFGREKETRLIVSNLFASNLTVLYGASGSGKSSVLRAAVLPFLQQEKRTVAVYFNEWQDQQFLTLLKQECAQTAGLEASPDLSLDLLISKIEDATASSVLLVLDQFEEYTLYHEAGHIFESELARLVNRDDSDMGVLLSLRDDCLAQLDRFRARIPQLLANTLRLDNLSVDAARSAITKPLEVFNRQHPDQAIEVEESLVDELLRQIPSRESPERIETPYLQLVLERLWQQLPAQPPRALRLQMLSSIGGAARIVEAYLGEELRRLQPAERDTVSSAFERLVTPSGTKIAYSLADLASYAGKAEHVVQPTLERLSKARLLRRLDQPVRYEIFHDVLGPAARDWRLQEERNRVNRRFRWRLALVALGGLAALSLAAYAWFQRSAAIELREQTLKLNQQLIEGNNALAKQILETTMASREAGYAKQVAQARGDEALKEARSALAHQLAAAAIGAGPNDPNALLLARLAALLTLKHDGFATEAAVDALRRSWQPKPVQLPWPGHTSEVTAVAIDSAKRLIATYGALRLSLWRAQNLDPIVHVDNVQCSTYPWLSFSQDGSRLACGNSGGITLFDTKTLQPVSTTSPINLQQFFNQFALSPDGLTIATSEGNSQQLMLYDAGADKPRFRRPLPEKWALSDRYFATYENQRIRLFNNRDGSLVAEDLLTMDRGIRVTALAFSPQGDRLGAGLQNGDIILDAVPDLSTFYRGLRIPDIVTDLTLHRDGSLVVVNRKYLLGTNLLRQDSSDLLYAVADDGSVGLSVEGAALKLFEYRNFDEAPFADTRQSNYSMRLRPLALSLSRDLRTVAALSDTWLLFLWDTTTGSETRPSLSGAENRMALSPDGRQVAVTRDRWREILVRDVTTDRTRRLSIDKGLVAGAIAFSPISDRLASVNSANQVLIFPLDQASPPVAIPVAPSDYFSLAFSQNGRLFAASGSELDVVETDTGRKLSNHNVPLGLAYAITFLSGNRIFAAGRQEAAILDLSSGKWTEVEGEAEVTGPTEVAASLSGMQVAYAGGQDRIYIRDQFGALITTIYGSRPLVLGFDPAGKQLGVLDAEMRFYRHPLEVETLLRESAGSVKVKLSDSICQRYLQMKACPDVLTQLTQ